MPSASAVMSGRRLRPALWHDVRHDDVAEPYRPHPAALPIKRVDRSGRISKCGDPLRRAYLFEAAGIALNRVSRWCALKAWGTRVVIKIGSKKATVAVARTLAVILHLMWCGASVLRWASEEG
jgi:hypothetical protein